MALFHVASAAVLVSSIVVLTLCCFLLSFSSPLAFLLGLLLLFEGDHDFTWRSKSHLGGVKSVVEQAKVLLRKIVTPRNPAPNLAFHRAPGKTPLDEVVDIIFLSKFDATVVRKESQMDSGRFSPLVRWQLRDYISCIAST